MIHKKQIKTYVFERDGGSCYHCGKTVKFTKMTLDHYFPRSLGGTEAYYNLVTCCKTCNRLKRSVVPKDWMKVNIELFIQALEDDVVIKSQDIRLSREEILMLASQIETVFRNKINTVFEGPGFRLYVKENQVYKLVKFRSEVLEI